MLEDLNNRKEMVEKEIEVKRDDNCELKEEVRKLEIERKVVKKEMLGIKEEKKIIKEKVVSEEKI